MMVDGGVIGDDGGWWRDGVRVRVWVFSAVCCARQWRKTKTVLTFKFSKFHFLIFIFFNLKKSIK